ncbi:metallophosphatase [Halosquirtibacter xylanolyticus]|uniref:bifunctional metallophosphatase/5'-nucleotidase n=1 Tax=Halosquirtibacter xylanolyticus TaxID=3374599 RepID=UPI003749CA4E|nr:metallophosphatase [Prolixibacteraceae bacterium]
MENRRSFLKKLGAVSVGTGVVGTAFAESGKKTKKLTLLHTNDFHSHVDPFPTDAARHAGEGGLERRATMVNKIRDEEGEVLLVDAGDIFQGTPYFNYFKGEVELKCMSAMGYDAATIGNHEFDNGLEGIKSQLPHAKFPFICSNYDFSKTILDGETKEFLVLEKKGIKVGIYGLGVAFDGLVLERNYGETVYLDPLNTAWELEEKLKKEHKCDLIVCLSHMGYRYRSERVSDVKLAAATKHTNVIIGGHTHTFLSEPTIIQNINGKEVVVSQAGWAGVQLGRLDIEISDSKDPEYSFSVVKLNG